ncbi:hypothetical protein ASD64_16680 [Mesorhizobium sp. Root157]|uniref:YdeI/OmpD-associated family protein n=1 Tax=Mesorhizobium sp. Root157 TaxID=1736477 RepID=UPI0006F3C9A6|nr:YdeI/OmpD-associated family protein [Mesorhizobium sp. Root157]KQZ97834.1 hypothetical protein ASD64_16680 [Mesorhizobium sp. Root157]
MSGLKRAINPMPDDVRALLDAHALAQAYAERPAYQRNDYLGWIASAKQRKTRQRRIDQMLDELQRGGVYMNMAWRG